MQKIVLLNPKGGSGKTTLATNLASYFAVSGLRPTLMDMDAQGSSTRWLSKRETGVRHIHGIAAFERNSRVTRSFATRLPLDTERLVVDTPAALSVQDLPDITRNATAILVPVLPSDIDIHAAARCISNLLLIAKVKREEQRVAVIANRVKKNTVMYKSLMRFLETLDIPVVTTLRDSQNYIRASEKGLGLFEMKSQAVRDDLEQWLPLVGWLEQRKALDLQPGAPALTSMLKATPVAAPAEADRPLAAATALENSDEARPRPGIEDSHLVPSMPVSQSHGRPAEAHWWTRLQSRVMTALRRPALHTAEPVSSD
jgi:chromosome partitioning protein